MPLLSQPFNGILRVVNKTPQSWSTKYYGWQTNVLVEVEDDLVGSKEHYFMKLPDLLTVIANYVYNDNGWEGEFVESTHSGYTHLKPVLEKS